MKEQLIISQNKLNIANLVLGLFAVCIPLIIFLFGCFGVTVSQNIVLVLFVISYAVFLVILSINLITSKTYREKLIKTIKNPIAILAIIILIWMTIASLVNNAFNPNFILYLSFFALFICVTLMKNQHLNILLNTLLIVVAISCILGMIDPANTFMPGFVAEQHSFAIFYVHPNHSGYVVALLSIVVFNYFHKAKSVIKHILYGIIYVIFGYFLFLNGSFSPIVALVIVEVFETIFMWVKTKHIPIKMLSLLLTLIPLCFLSDIYPNIENLRTCKYNFFLECIAVFDNIFGTNILSVFNITEVAGSDGWARDSLLADTMNFITKDTKTFLFGAGAGTAIELKPHNVFLNLWVDFGVIVPAIFATTIILLIIKHIKSKFSFDNFANLSAVISFIIMMMFGSIFACSFIYFIVFFALSFRINTPKEDENIEEISNKKTKKSNNKKTLT